MALKLEGAAKEHKKEECEKLFIELKGIYH